MAQLTLCDSDVIIKFLLGNADVINILDLRGIEGIFISAITYSEVILGTSDRKDFQRTKQVLDTFTIIEVEENISQLMRTIIDRFAVSHRPGIPDMIIAATAIRYDVELFTLNTRHFTFLPKLKLIKHSAKPLAKKPR